MRPLLVLLMMMLSPLASHAQGIPGVPTTTATEVPAAETADASIDELVRILQNDDSRALLIERLQQSAGTEADGALSEGPADISIVSQLAEYTRSAAEGVSATVASLGRVVTNIQRGLSGTSGQELRSFLDIAANLVIVGALLFLSFLALRLAVHWMQKHIASRVDGRGWISRIGGSFGASLFDLGSVILAWAIGYAVALFVLGATPGQMRLNQSLLLNAFLIVEVAKMVSRIILAPRFSALRLVPVSDSNAAYWNFWIARFTSLVGYTFLFVSPLVANNLDRGLAGAVQVLVMATAVTIGIIIVLQNRDDVRNWLNRLSSSRNNDGYGQLLQLLGRYWHMIAIAYLLALLVVWFANPRDALPFMLGATVQSLIAILVGVIIVSFIGRFVSSGVHLPQDISQRLPLLETRLHAFVPAVMSVVRWVVIIGVVIAITQAWRLFDFVGWIGSASGQHVAGSIISALLIIFACVVLHVVVASWVEYRLNPNFGKPATAREKTLLNLFKNAFTIALVVFGLMLALGQIGVNIAPLLAGAGVIGLAIGFGAQKLVQDIITGIFIQFENVMNEGDVVEAAGKSGVVEKLTIRSVTIRDMSGTVHLIPFSSVDQVSNMVRGFSFYVAEFEVSRDADIEAVKQTLRDAFTEVMASEHKNVILDELDLQGLIAITPQSVSLRARIKTLAGQQWGAGRLYSELVMRKFIERGIETPTQRINYIAGPRGHQVDGMPLDGAPQPG